jgi:hypothetical protein
MPDDIKYLAPFVLGHRIILSHDAKVAGRTSAMVIDSILETVALPQVSVEEVCGQTEASLAGKVVE